MTWWFTTFMAPAIKQKVHSLPGVEYLYSVMSPDQLEIPAYITEYDMTVSVYYCVFLFSFAKQHVPVRTRFLRTDFQGTENAFNGSFA